MIYSSFLRIEKAIAYKLYGEDEPIVVYRYNRNGETKYGWGYYFNHNPNLTSGIRFSTEHGYLDGGDSAISVEDIRLHEEYFKSNGRQIYSGNSMADVLKYLHKYY